MGGKENVWADTYGAKDGPILKIRNAGWQGTLIVDSAAYAQSSWTLLKYAKVMKVFFFFLIFEHKNLSNLIFFPKKIYKKGMGMIIRKEI
jgi:hypothetical protein